jgi:hypothetical protein
VDPGSLQFIAQQSRAAETRGELFCSNAFLQHGIMPDSAPPECVGTPASALPPSIRTKTKDAIRFVIVTVRIIRSVIATVKQRQ